MATVTALTAARMLEIEAASVVDGEIVAGNLILSKHDGSEINAGSVAGPQGIQGDPGEGVPVGGTTGQLLAKNSGTNYDTEWVDPPASGWEVIAEGSISVATTFDISSIPQTFKDLKLRLKIACSTGSVYIDVLQLRFAGDSGANYDSGYAHFNNGVLGMANSDNAGEARVAVIPANNSLGDAYGTVELVIPNYRDTDYRQVLAMFSALSGQSGGDQKWFGTGGGLWQNANADALTSIRLFVNGGGAFRSGSKFVLEGRN